MAQKLSLCTQRYLWETEQSWPYDTLLIFWRHLSHFCDSTLLCPMALCPLLAHTSPAVGRWWVDRARSHTWFRWQMTWWWYRMVGTETKEETFVIKERSTCFTHSLYVAKAFIVTIKLYGRGNTQTWAEGLLLQEGSIQQQYTATRNAPSAKLIGYNPHMKTQGK